MNDTINTPSMDGHRQVSFAEALPLFFKNYVNFVGRSSRGAYWWYVLWGILLTFVATLLDVTLMGASLDDSGPIELLLNFVLLIPGLAISVRRLHDIGKSGWWLLLILTVIGILVILFWAVQPGDRNQNKYGQDVEAGRGA